MDCTSNSLPTPVSPKMSTLIAAFAARVACSYSRNIAGSRTTMLSFGSGRADCKCIDELTATLLLPGPLGLLRFASKLESLSNVVSPCFVCQRRARLVRACRIPPHADDRLEIMRLRAHGARSVTRSHE